MGMRGFGLCVAMVIVLAAGQAFAAGIDLSKPYGDKYGCINRNGQEVAADQMLLLTDEALVTAASTSVIATDKPKPRMLIPQLPMLTTSRT